MADGEQDDRPDDRPSLERKLQDLLKKKQSVTPSGPVFFQQQTTYRRFNKRYRKTPDELPANLRYAHLNPKVAAYYKAKDKEDGDEGLEDKDDDREAKAVGGGLGKKSLLPEIDQYFNLLKSELDNALEMTEQSHKELLDKNRFAAPGLLSQISKLLYDYENIPAIFPKKIEQCLTLNYQELAAGAKKFPQTFVGYSQSLESDSQPRLAKKSSRVGRADRPDRPGSGDNEVVGAITISVTGATDCGDDRNAGHRITSRQNSVINDAGGSSLLVDTGRRDSKLAPLSAPPGGGRGKSRGSKSGSIIDLKASANSSILRRQLLGISVDNQSNADQTSDTKSVIGGNQGFYYSTIQFLLSSKQCDDKGWIIHADGSQDNLAQEAVQHWALHRLKEAKRALMAQEEKDRENGHERPLQIRYYGDNRKEGIVKLRKGSSHSASTGHALKIPTIPTLDWKQDSRTIFMTTLPDGSTSLYYPSGRTAVVASRAGDQLPGFYTLVYEDADSGTMMASFTPSGCAACNHSNGLLKFLFDKNGGSLYDVHGATTKTWTWPANNAKMVVPVTVQISQQMALRCVSQSQMHLFFNCQREQIKFNVGKTAGATEPHPDDLGVLQSGMPVLSQTAKNQFKKKTQQQKQKKTSVKSKGSKTSQVISDLQALTADMQPGSEIDQQLRKLESKAMMLCEEWLEHYRVHTGVTSPALRTLEEAPRPRGSRRHVQSARVANSDPGKGSTTNNRAPSAPVMSQSVRPLSATSDASTTTHRHGAGTTPTVVTFQDKSPVLAVPSETGDPDWRSNSSSPHPNFVPNNARSRPASTRRSKSVISCLSLPDRSPACRPGGVCPAALRQEVLGHESPACHCSRHRMPYLTDIEYDVFVRHCIPPRQLLIVSVISSLFPTSGGACSQMVEKLYQERNKNRTRPCVQVRGDPIRLVRYDVATAAFDSDHSQPMLLTRHNVVPGMFLMYEKGCLLFCDHIFNGYGNARKDFQKQLMKTRHDGTMGLKLPSDFKFSPQTGRHGRRAAWGGEIGGAGIDRRGSPGTKANIARTSSSESSLESVLSRPQAVTYQLSLIVSGGPP